MLVRLATVVCLLTCLGSAAAEDEPAPPLTPEQAADGALAAVKDGDQAALKALAGRERPDPWLVADELCYRAEHDAAAALAKAAPPEVIGDLAAHVAARRDQPADERAHKTLAALRVAFAKRDIATALRLGSELPLPLEGVAHIEIGYACGMILRSQHKLKESAEAMQRVIEAATAIGWTRRVADAHHHRGVSLYFAGDVSGALAAWEAEVAISRRLGDPPRVLKTLGNIAATYHRLGKYREALARYEEVLAAMRKLGLRTGMSDTLANLGMTHRALGDPEAALVKYQEALPIAQELGDRSQEASAHRGIGNVYSELGRYEAALDSLGLALRIHEAGADLRGVVYAVADTASVHLHLGRHGQALAGYERAIALHKRLGDEAGLANAVSNVGVVYKRLGDNERALESFQRALEIQTRLGLEPGIANALNNLAVVNKRMGETELALRQLDQALKLNRKLGDRRSVLRQLLNRAATLAVLDQPEAALAGYTEVLPLAEDLKDLAVVSTAHLNISDVYLQLRDMEQALAARQRALAALEQVPSPDTRAHVLRGMAEIHLHRKAYQEALRAAREGIATVNQLTTALAEGEGAGGRELFWRIYGTGVLASVALKDTDAVAWMFEQSRANSLREALGSRSAMEGVLLPPALRTALDTARRTERRALAAYRALAGTRTRSERGAAHRAWKEARAAGERVMARVQRESKAAAAVVLPEPDDVATLQSHLREGEALLLYTLTQSNGVALLIDGKGARTTVLAGSDEISSAIDATALDDPDAEPRGLDRLRDLLATPLKLDAGIRRLLISPEGKLAYVPLGLVFPGREVAYVSSGTTYGLLRAETGARGAKVLALGDPDYQARGVGVAQAIRAGGVSGLPRLPATKDEVEAIADVRLLGARASETGLAEALGAEARWRAVHFACHGLVDPDRPMLSALALTADTKNDGFLTALEVFRLKIPADLVVLSACETGKGKVFRTEGIVGLTRAFMFAGAPSVLCSLWKVDDKATQALMIKFYELWNPRGSAERRRGIGAAEALQKAQEHIRSQEKWKHPYYWAAWVLWGLAD